ncbi:hypothetical protein C8J57DRAFT_1301196 [Mycena rebaudengoi]|nr:hypothetical protein C8J57DRAFT_1301196 [Mycena rebaudengoi]
MAFNPLPGVRYRIQSVGSHTFIGIRDVNSSALAMLPDNEEDDRQQWTFRAGSRDGTYKIMNCASSSKPRYLSIGHAKGESTARDQVNASRKHFKYWTLEQTGRQNICSVAWVHKNVHAGQDSLFVNKRGEIRWIHENLLRSPRLVENRHWRFIAVSPTVASHDDTAVMDSLYSDAETNSDNIVH